MQTLPSDMIETNFQFADPAIAAEARRFMTEPRPLLARLFPSAADREREKMATKLVAGDYTTHLAVIGAMQRATIGAAELAASVRLAQVSVQMKLAFNRWFDGTMLCLQSEITEQANRAVANLRVALETYRGLADLEESHRAAYAETVNGTYFAIMNHLNSAIEKFCVDVDRKLRSLDAR